MTRLVVVLGFVVAFAAGFMVEKGCQQPVAQPTTRPSRHGWLTAELNLTPVQQEQLKKIWSETALRGGRERDDRHKQLARQRDEAIAALIRPEDKARYEEIRKSYADQTAAMDREAHIAYQTAVENTKQILTPDQRTRYEEFLRHQSERGSSDRHHGEREHEPGRWGEHRGASRPASQP